MRTYQFIWKLICYRPWLYFLNGFVWILIHLSPLLVGLLTREFFNNLSGEATPSFKIWELIGLVLALALGRVVFILSGALTDTLHRFYISSLIRRNLLDYLLRKAKGKFNIGDTIINFREDANQAETSVSWTLDVIGKFIFATVSLVLLISVNAKITLLVFIPIVFIIIIANKSSVMLTENRKKSLKSSADVVGIIQEITEMTQAIQVGCAEKRFINELELLNKKRSKIMIKDRFLTESLNSIFNTTISIGTGLILILSAGSMRDGTFKVGDLALFIYYLGFITDFTQFFGQFLAHYRQTEVSFIRMGSLLSPNEKLLVDHKQLFLKEQLFDNSSETIICNENFESLKIVNLSYLFPETSKGIQSVSFELKKGSFTVVTGRIGSGKTTLLRTLLGFLPKQSGEIYFNNQNVEEGYLSPPRVAYTSQVPQLFNLSIRENILLGKTETSQTIDKSIYSAVLEDDISEFDRGLETMVGTHGARLSGGQRQRTAIARMFAQESDIFILDDISSALDVETENILWSRMSERINSTFLVTSHRKECFMRADQIIVLKDGKIESIGSLNELLQNSLEMKSLWNANL